MASHKSSLEHLQWFQQITWVACLLADLRKVAVHTEYVDIVWPPRRTQRPRLAVKFQF